MNMFGVYLVITSEFHPLPAGVFYNMDDEVKRWTMKFSIFLNQ